MTKYLTYTLESWKCISEDYDYNEPEYLCTFNLLRILYILGIKGAGDIHGRRGIVYVQRTRILHNIRSKYKV